MPDAADFARLMEPVARRLLGTPRTTYRGGLEWRYGNHESFKVEIDIGLWHDFDTEEKGGTLDLIKFKLGLPDRAAAAKWLEDQGYVPRSQPPPPQQDHTDFYRYCDQDGSVVLKVTRWYQHGERRFSQRAPDPENPGDWIKPSAVKGGAKRVPYRLPEMLIAIGEGKTIFFVEGEKDVETLHAAGLTATTNSEGGNNHKWLPEIVPYFSGADVVILPDYDLKGKTHSERIAKLLTGTAKRVRLLDWENFWPQAKTKNDVSDYLSNGGTAEALLEHVEKLPTWIPPKQQRTSAKVIQFPGGIKPHWFDELGKNNSGRALTDLHNVMSVLYAERALVDCFAFNEMSQTSMLMQDLPPAPGCGERSIIPRQITEDDVGCLQRWLQWQQIRSVPFDTVRQAIELRAFDRRFHPISNWLDSLEPQGSDDVLNTWLHNYFGCPNDEYHQAIGRMFLIAMVARIYKPGCQADYMLVLEGPQGEVKSQACRALAGDEYFSDHLPEVGGDQVRLSMALRGKWLIEISELSSFSKADSALLKSFLTRQIEIFVPKFSRIEKREPRQCLFVGTTNDDTYLKDETGGRRFWPVKCGTINLDDLRQARTQLFAHAVERYNHAEQYWPNREFEKTTIAPQQTARLYQDAWLAPVQAWLKKQVIKSFTLIEIAEGAIPGFKAAQFGMSDQRRLGAVLRLCHWKATHSRSGNTWEPDPDREPL